MADLPDILPGNFGELYPNLADFANLAHAWVTRAFDDLDVDFRQLRRFWYTIARTIGSTPILTLLDKENFDVRFVPQGILFRLMQMCEHGSEEAFVATSIRNIMPELILGYFSRQKVQCWYYLVDRDYPPPYVFGKPLSITSARIPTV